MTSHWQKTKLKHKDGQRKKELENHFKIKEMGSRKMPESTQSIEKPVTSRPDKKPKIKKKIK